MAQVNPNPSKPNDPNFQVPNANPNLNKDDLECGCGDEMLAKNEDMTVTPRGVNDDNFSAADRDRNRTPDVVVTPVSRDRDVIRDKDVVKDTNPDPITGAPGSHPIGTGIGAAAGGAAGAAIGSVIPGAGTVVGGVIGAVVGAVGGGLAGKGIAEAIDPTAEDAYWRESYRTRPYVTSSEDYDLYQPAYRYGWEARSRYAGRSWEDVEPDLRRDWEHSAHHSNLSWERAKHAVRDAWHRVERKLPGDFDKDGR